MRSKAELRGTAGNQSSTAAEYHEGALGEMRHSIAKHKLTNATIHAGIEERSWDEFSWKTTEERQTSTHYMRVSSR